MKRRRLSGVAKATILFSVAYLVLGLAMPVANAGCPPPGIVISAKPPRTFMPAPVKRHWKWVKAQTIVESACRPDVCSHVGACGLLQIMSPTWKELTGREPGTSIFQPKLNIVQGTRYQAWQVGQWLGRPRSPAELYELGLCGFNGGWVGASKPNQSAAGLVRGAASSHVCRR